MELIERVIATLLAEFSDFSQLEANERGGITVDDRHMTNLPGVFAGGDIVQGSSLVVQTVRDARKAAADIDRYLRPQGDGEAVPS